MRFADTNILLYAISRQPAEASKAAAANALLDNGDLALSSQVLQEFYVQATRSTRSSPLTHEQAASLVTAFGRFPIQETTLALVHAAMASCRRFQISYWDAAIIEAGRLMGCTHVLSEDLNHGQDYDGIRVINPFL